MKKYWSMLLVACTLISCSSNKIKDHLVVVGDSLGDVEVRDLRSMRINDLLMAQGTFFNTGNKPAQGYYRCLFLDTQNFQIGSNQTWNLLTIYPNQGQSFKCQSTNFEATNFKIEFANNAENVTIYH